MSTLRPRFLSFWTLHILGAFAASNNAPICAELDSKLPGRIYSPGSKVYEDSLGSYYTLNERELDPSCIFRPTSTSEVLDFATRFSGGAANIDGGVTIDMRTLNGVKVNEERTVVSIGGGAIWARDVYPELVKYNLIAAGARAPGVGIGGFVTGGGLTHLARRNGWACDNIVGYEVVLGSGEVVYASKDENRDLWRSISGGSNNFGIVTRFDTSTYPQKNMLGGTVAWNYDQSVKDSHAKAFSDFMKPENFDADAMMAIIVSYGSGTWILLDSFFYLKPELAPAVYNQFYEIPGNVSDNLAVGTVEEIVNNLGADFPTTFPYSEQRTYTFRNGDASLYTALFKAWDNGTASLVKKKIPGLALQYYTQPSAVTNGQNSMGLEPGAKDKVLITLAATWNNAADTEFMEAWLDSMRDNHVGILRENGLLEPFIYLNYAGGKQDPIGSYGTKEQLQAVSKKYDPKGIFQKLVPGGFKLFK
ncbi:oxidoreductase FAD-binding protein [Phaeosphaeriaceae sp. PMI808]|nr:oxidoreductase FAD-binding protein [Phaeosphaeriaceae sp. PMI808]